MIVLIQQLRAANTLARLSQLERRQHVSHADMHRRDQCIAKLAAIGSPAVPLILRRLEKLGHADPTHSLSIIIQQMGDVAVPELERAMHHPNPQIRHLAMLLLGRIGTPAALRALDDESVDLVDKEALEAARAEARHHGHEPHQTL